MEPIIKKDQINIAMLGMVDMNGHPYSWSAIVNGYDKKAMQEYCGPEYPVIPDYLGKQPKETFGIPGVKVTHIWCDNPEDAKKVSAASLIPNVVSKPEDVIGEVDAVIIPTDRGDEHVWRARPFIEAGLPVFLDKPMADNMEDLRTICNWVKNGAHIMSSSSLRFQKSLVPYHNKNYYEIGDMRFILSTMQKSWERYGMHALEAIFPITGRGYLTVQNTGVNKDRNIIHLTHKDNFDAVIASIYDMSGLGVSFAGNKGSCKPVGGSSFEAFKAQLVSYVHYLRTGERPCDWEDTVEMSKIIAAGIMSREQDGKKIYLEDLEV